MAVRMLLLLLAFFCFVMGSALPAYQGRLVAAGLALFTLAALL